MCSIQKGIDEILEKIQEVTAARNTYPLYGDEMEDVKKTINSVLTRRTDTLWVYAIESTKETGVVLAPTESEAKEKVKRVIIEKSKEDDTYPLGTAFEALTVIPAEVTNAYSGGVYSFQ